MPAISGEIKIRFEAYIDVMMSYPTTIINAKIWFVTQSCQND